MPFERNSKKSSEMKGTLKFLSEELCECTEFHVCPPRIETFSSLDAIYSIKNFDVGSKIHLTLFGL